MTRPPTSKPCLLCTRVHHIDHGANMTPWPNDPMTGHTGLPRQEFITWTQQGFRMHAKYPMSHPFHAYMSVSAHHTCHNPSSYGTRHPYAYASSSSSSIFTAYVPHIPHGLYSYHTHGHQSSSGSSSSSIGFVTADPSEEFASHSTIAIARGDQFR